MPDAATAEAIKHVRAVHSAFGEAMSKLGDIEGPGPVERVALYFLAFGFRQVQAILTLAEASDKLHLQVGQLLRSLLEGWLYAAWMLGPATEEARTQRVIGWEIDGVKLQQEKVQYQLQHRPAAVNPAHQRAVDRHAAELQAEKAKHGAKGVPGVRGGMEALGRADRYIVWRWESDVAHLSTTGLGQLADKTGPTTVIGGAGRPDQALARLAATWDVASDLYELVAHALDIELPGWEEHRQTTLRSFTALTKRDQEEE
jgi:hypothetical protein